ncbi:hypothetical protein WR25_16789 [Diploscapter pachys]|uniref:DMAP1-binding domain-containing protein n=1 Tax=Diploscapter pachys TaxID=2018661 RepID=A0A2A2LJN8_9BILA|nr:hypothetical protein WR25_16789 [Diploscapter pachys]
MDSASMSSGTSPSNHYAVGRICFPSLALSKRNCPGSNGTGLQMRKSSDNHRDYLHRKSASMKEKRIRAEQRRLALAAQNTSPRQLSADADDIPLPSPSYSNGFSQFSANSDLSSSMRMDRSMPCLLRNNLNFHSFEYSASSSDSHEDVSPSLAPSSTMTPSIYTSADYCTPPDDVISCATSLQWVTFNNRDQLTVDGSFYQRQAERRSVTPVFSRRPSDRDRNRSRKATPEPMNISLQGESRRGSGNSNSTGEVVVKKFELEGLGERRMGWGGKGAKYSAFAAVGILSKPGQSPDNQRPKSRPLHEFYNDDDIELEALAKQRDPTAPRPEGAMMTPVRGENPREANGSSSSAQTQPRSLDSALHRFGTTAAKSTAGIVLDQAGKPGVQITYGKLLRRANKIAYTLLNKTITVGKENSKMPICKPGDRVALVYPNAEPLQFLAAFHGCLIAGVIPVPVEVPLTKRDAGIAQLGFLLGNNGVKVALTSETCYKGLPKKSWTYGGAATPSGSSSLNGQSAEMVDFKGWPRLYWLITEHLPKPSRDWTAAARAADDTVAYIEYSTDRDGAVKGVCVSRQTVVAHCKALVNALEYKQNETLVCVVDFKREFGLWHAVLAATYVGMRVVFVPYSLTKMNPASWMVMATKMHASVAVVKSRDLHWGVLASRDTSEINLSSLRSLIVADGANPWSLSSCDHFVRTFSAHGLRPDAMCPCAGSSETGAISVRSWEMLQDAGQVISGGVVVVVQLEGPSRLCKADEIGEICLCANSTGQSYWALEGQTQATFKVEPLNENDKPIGVLSYVRSGLIGFMAPDGLVFVVGKKSSLLRVSGRQHSADDIIATVLAVEPMRFVYRGRICVFSVNVLRDERIVIVAEQKAGCSEEDSFNWMNRVLQAIEAIHSVGIYCIALVPPNQLPKAPLGGIHVSETKQRFEAGELHPSTIQMCPHSCILNLPKPRERQSDVGPAAIFVGNIVQGVRIAGAQGAALDDDMSLPLADILRSRAQTHADHRIFTLVTAKNAEHDTATFASLLKRSEKVAALLTDKSRLNTGDHIVLVFQPSIDLIAAFFGCLLAGMVPVCVRPPTAATLQSTLPNLRSTVDISKAVAILSSAPITKLLKSKEAVHCVDSKAWPMILDVEDAPSSWKRKINSLSELREISRSDVCYMDFSMNSCGQLSGVVISMEAAISLCKGLKLSCELYPSRHVLVCADPYSGLGLALWCLSSVFSSHHTTLIPPTEIEANPQLFLQTLSASKIRDAFTTYAVVENNVRELAAQVAAMKERGVNLSTIRTCVIVAEERPRINLLQAFCRLFAPLGLANRAVSTSFGCAANPAICMQGAAAPESSTVYVDARALRNDRVTLVGKGAPHSIALLESGKIMPGVKIAIANPETRGQCADSHLGEIWVCSPQNASGSFTVFGEENGMQTDHFNARLTTGDVKTRWARTGYLGFLRQTQSITEHGDLHDAVFVVGALDESLQLRGMRFHPVDLEATVSKAHRHIGEA